MTRVSHLGKQEKGEVRDPQATGIPAVCALRNFIKTKDGDVGPQRRPGGYHFAGLHPLFAGHESGRGQQNHHIGRRELRM